MLSMLCIINNYKSTWLLEVAQHKLVLTSLEYHNQLISSKFSLQGYPWKEHTFTFYKARIKYTSCQQAAMLAWLVNTQNNYSA